MTNSNPLQFPSTVQVVVEQDFEIECLTDNQEPEPIRVIWPQLTEPPEVWQLHHVEEILDNYRVTIRYYETLQNYEWTSEEGNPPPEYGQPLPAPDYEGEWVAVGDPLVTYPPYDVYQHTFVLTNREEPLFYYTTIDTENEEFYYVSDESDIDAGFGCDIGYKEAGEVTLAGIHNRDYHFDLRKVYDKSIFKSIEPLTKPAVNSSNHDNESVDWWEEDIEPVPPDDPGYPIDAVTTVDIKNEEPVMIEYSMTIGVKTRQVLPSDMIDDPPTPCKPRPEPFPIGHRRLLSRSYTLTLPVIHPRITWTQWVINTVRDSYYKQGYYPYLQRDFETPGIGY